MIVQTVTPATLQNPLDWRELERARVLANPLIRRPRWTCSHMGYAPLRPSRGRGLPPPPIGKGFRA